VPGNPSPNINFVPMFGMTLELRLFSFVSETELGMLPHVKGALVCKDDIAKCFSVFIALQKEL